MTYTTATIAPIAQVLAQLPIARKLQNSSAESPNYEDQKATEMENCQFCRGLEECQYRFIGNRGFHPVWTEWAPTYPTVTACKYRVIWGEQMATWRRYGESGLPERYRGIELATIVNDNNADIVTKLTEIAEGATKDLIIKGASNTGKTKLLSAFGNSLLKAGKSVKYVTAGELTMKLRFSNPAFEDSYEWLTTVPYLLIDDLGSERWSEYNEEQLTNVLSKRRRSTLSTVITTSKTEYMYTGRLYEDLYALEEIEIEQLERME